MKKIFLYFTVISVLASGTFAKEAEPTVKVKVFSVGNVITSDDNKDYVVDLVSRNSVAASDIEALSSLQKDSRYFAAKIRLKESANNCVKVNPTLFVGLPVGDDVWLDIFNTSFPMVGIGRINFPQIIPANYNDYWDTSQLNVSVISLSMDAKLTIQDKIDSIILQMKQVAISNEMICSKKLSEKMFSENEEKQVHQINDEVSPLIASKNGKSTAAK